MARRIKSPGTVGSPVSVSQPNMAMLDSEDSKVTQVGTWSSVEDNEAVGGSYLRSNTTNSYLQFSFKGSALWVRFKFGSDCGKASITIEDTAYPTVDLYNALDLFKYVNVAVGLDENTTHAVKITVAGTKNASSTDFYVNVDAFTYRLTEEALSLQNIEYIDLINVINTINKINEIVTISNIANISNIENISVIQKIAEAPWIANLGVAINGGFETGNLVGWTDPADCATVTSAKAYEGKYSCNLKASTTGIIQYYSPPILIDNVIKSSIRALFGDKTNDKLNVKFYFTDGTTGNFTIEFPTDADVWYLYDLAYYIKTRIIASGGHGRKHFYCIELRNSGTTDTLYIDNFTLFSLPTNSRLTQNSILFNDVSVTVAYLASGETANAGYAPVTPGQVLIITLEHRVTGWGIDTVLELHVTWHNSDKTQNAEEKIGFYWISTDWVKYGTPLIVPDGVAYVGLHGYFYNAYGGDQTFYLRNIKVFPIAPPSDNVDGVPYTKVLSDISNVANISLIQSLSSITGLSTVGKVNQLSTVGSLSTIEAVAPITKYLSLTSLAAGGTADVWDPTAGTTIRLKRFQISVSGATGVTLQWSGATAVTDFEHYVLPDKGSVVVNLIGCNEEAPEADAILRVKSGAAAFVTCKASGEEV